MPKIGISKYTSDATYGTVLLNDKNGESEVKNLNVRVNITETLDGGVYVDYLGYAEGDRDFTVTAEITKAQETILLNMVKTQEYVGVSTSEGYFLGSIRTLKITNGKATIEFLISDMLSA